MWQIEQDGYAGMISARAGFKLGVGRKDLFDSNTAFFEIFNYANSFSQSDNRYGIKVTGHMNAALWAAVVDSINPPTTTPHNSYMLAGFFDGNLYCTASIHAGASITTRCQFSDGGMISTDAQGHSIDNDGNGGMPKLGNYYGGWTGELTEIDRAGRSGKYKIRIVNGLIVGWRNY